MPYVVTLSKIAPTEKDVEHLIRKGTLTRKEVNLI